MSNHVQMMVRCFFHSVLNLNPPSFWIRFCFRFRVACYSFVALLSSHSNNHTSCSSITITTTTTTIPLKHCSFLLPCWVRPSRKAWPFFVVVSSARRRRRRQEMRRGGWQQRPPCPLLRNNPAATKLSTRKSACPTTHYR